MIYRNITNRLLESLTDTPVVFLRGARQTGKSTLVKALVQKEYPADYVTLDNAGFLSAATSDPAGFLAGFNGPVVIDEVQKALKLFPAIKESVDNDRRAGRYLLTGSSNVLATIRASESLAGRMEVFTLRPFSRGELKGTKETFIDAAFDAKTKVFRFQPENRKDILRQMLTGGYPEAVARTSEKRRAAWFDAYITTILERDVRDISNIQDLAAMPRLLKMLASRCAGLLNYANISRDLGMPQTTLKRYAALMQATFLLFELPPWSANIGKRLVKSPKLMFTDTGLAANLLGLDRERVEQDPGPAGAILENFVVSELYKQAAWSETTVNLFHFRTQTGLEVDVVLEDASGRAVGLEVKLSSTPFADDFLGMKTLKQALGKRFVRGVVLYLGSEVVPFGENLHAVPLSVLYS